MDDDLILKTKEELILEVKLLRSGIRDHRDSSGQGLCWHHPKLWSLLPEKVDPKILVPVSEGLHQVSSVVGRTIAPYAEDQGRI